MNNKIIEKIAKKITLSYKNKTAYSISVRENGNISTITINSIKIIIKTDRLINNKNINSKKKRIINEKGEPRYNLDYVKLILSVIPINIEFHPRPKANPENIGITKEQAIEILKSLQPSEFK